MTRSASVLRSVWRRLNDGLSAALAPLVLVSLDPLAPEATVSGVLDLGGWAASTKGPIVRGEAFLDGRPIGELQYGDARPDVARAHPWVPRECGFQGRFSLADAAAGNSTLAVRVTDALGNQRVVSCPIAIRPRAAAPPAAPANPSTILLVIDEPAPGFVAPGFVSISGWAFHPETPISRVEVVIDGGAVAVLDHGLARPDVNAVHPNPYAPRCGFRGTVDLEGRELGLLRLAIRITDVLGGTVESAVEGLLVEPQAPAAEVEMARWKNGVLTVAGWALWPASVPPIAVRVFFGGTLAGQTAANLSRPDIRARFSANRAAARCGFRARLRVPGSAEPAGGLREVDIEIVDRMGRVFQRRAHVDGPWGTTGVSTPEVVDRLAEIIADFRLAYGRDPAILDWNTGLAAADDFPGHLVFSPPPWADEEALPYLDGSVDVVLVRSNAPGVLAEARRVAALAVYRTAPESGFGFSGLRLEWAEAAPRVNTRPVVSILIPVRDHSAYTVACLEALARTLPRGLDGEIVVVDDGSSDDTPAVLQEWATRDKRIRVLQNASSLGFVDSCNLAAEAAAGDVLVFLNNDTIPRPGWLQPLLWTLREKPAAGAVGGKLLNPDGTLQEAGGVVFSDGTALKFGGGAVRVETPLYNFAREVDYCSAALLATPRDLFWRLGGFDGRYRPAYYEDTDYGFTLRASGLKVYYQPASTVVHFEGVTAGRDLDCGVKRYQEVNRVKFREKWAEALRRQPPAPAVLDDAAAHALAVRQEIEP